jgi:hypothetical protein
MTIEIHQPELEALIQSFTQFLMESPLAGSGLEFERIHDDPRPVVF